MIVGDNIIVGVNLPRQLVGVVAIHHYQTLACFSICFSEDCPLFVHGFGKGVGFHIAEVGIPMVIHHSSARVIIGTIGIPQLSRVS